MNFTPAVRASALALFVLPLAAFAQIVTDVTAAYGDSVVIYRGATPFASTTQAVRDTVGYHQNSSITGTTDLIGNSGTVNSWRNGNVFLAFTLPTLTNTLQGVTLNLYKSGGTATFIDGGVDLYAFVPGASPRTLSANNGFESVQYAGTSADPSADVVRLGQGVLTNAIANNTWVAIDLTALFQSGALSSFYDNAGEPTTNTIWFRFNPGAFQPTYVNTASIRIDNILGSGTATNPYLSFTTAAAIPEPSTYAAIFGALALAGVITHRRRKSAQG
jgi:hypothetical protein